MTTATRFPLRCDCHGSEILAVQVDDKVVIRATRHGKTHVLTLTYQGKVCETKPTTE